MKQLNGHMNSTNQKIHSFDNIGKSIIDLVIKKGGGNDEYYSELTDVHNSSLMGIVVTTENVSLMTKNHNQESAYVLCQFFFCVIFMLNKFYV